MNLFGLKFDHGLKECLVCKCTITPDNPAAHPALPLCAACVTKPINLTKLAAPETQRQLIAGGLLCLFLDANKRRRRTKRRRASLK